MTTIPPLLPALERRVVAIAIVLGVAWTAAGSLDASRAAFAASTSSRGNTVTTGTVEVTGDAPGTRLFDLDRWTPGASVARCTRVAYAGSAPADVRLHVAASGALAATVDLVVEAGRGAPDDAGCTSFVPDTTLYRGALGDLAARHGSFATGLGGFPDARPGESRTYRITATLGPDAPQAATAAADLTWEAAA